MRVPFRCAIALTAASLAATTLLTGTSAGAATRGNHSPNVMVASYAYKDMAVQVGPNGWLEEAPAVSDGGQQFVVRFDQSQFSPSGTICWIGGGCIGVAANDHLRLEPASSWRSQLLAFRQYRHGVKYWLLMLMVRGKYRNLVFGRAHLYFRTAYGRRDLVRFKA